MNKRDSILEQYSDFEFEFLDGFDDAIIGVSERFGSEPTVCYDKNKVINILQEDGMNYDDAYEYFSYNIIGAYVGEQTPVFLDVLESWEEDILE